MSEWRVSDYVSEMYMRQRESERERERERESESRIEEVNRACHRLESTDQHPINLGTK